MPDIIAISSEGKVIAVEMESVRGWKGRIEKFKEKYVEALMRDGFFDDVLVEGFLGIDWPTKPRK
ncbi:MAG TPA: hypothetical protein VJN71_07410 [Nitrososphaerales archaeon]|nr:hypothetical protein [Nitrososphaerales archaeon]